MKTITSRNQKVTLTCSEWLAVRHHLTGTLPADREVRYRIGKALLNNIMDAEDLTIVFTSEEYERVNKAYDFWARPIPALPTAS